RALSLSESRPAPHGARQLRLHLLTHGRHRDVPLPPLPNRSTLSAFTKEEAMRAILFVHRYLAVAVGLLMTLWCLSGFVMMYQDYPALDTEERLSGLEALNF